MLKATLILIIICILAWILTIFHEKCKYVAIFVTFVGFITILLDCTDFFTDYDPLKIIKQAITSNEPSPTKATTPPPSPSSSLKISLPKDTNSDNSSDKEINNSVQQEHIAKTAILNIGDTVFRDENDTIYIIWVPCANQENYKVKIEVDDPFSPTEKKLENICENNWCYIDVSDYPYDTIIFLSVGILDNETSEWIYSDPIHFTLY